MVLYLQRYVLKLVRVLFSAFPLAALLTLLSACEKPQKLEEGTNYESLRDKAVDEVLNGRLKPDSNGVIALPEALRSTSVNGQVLTAQHPTAGWIIAFPLNMRTRLDLLVYVQNSLPADMKNIAVGGTTIDFSGNIGQNWYRAHVR